MRKLMWAIAIAAAAAAVSPATAATPEECRYLAATMGAMIDGQAGALDALIGLGDGMAGIVDELDPPLMPYLDAFEAARLDYVAAIQAFIAAGQDFAYQLQLCGRG